MRAFLTALLAVIAIASPSVSATTYYVSSTGSDSNAGTSPSAPWQTIKQVNQAQSALRAGDSVLFCQGQRFEQITLTATTAGVSYSSYKCGSSTAMPVITNSRTVSGAWQTYGTNILKYDLSGDSNAINTGLATVWVNNKRYHTARYPNLLNPDVAYGVDASEFIMASSNSGSQINAAALTQPNNFFVGASIIFRIANWAYQSSTVLSSTQGSLHAADAPQTGSVGGFILQHNGAQDLNFFLDSRGEWAYDKASRTLYVYPVDSATRQGMLSGSISVSIAYGNVDSAMKISTANIAVSNIAFTQSLNGIAATSANGLTITGTNIQSHLGYGITAPNSASGVRISANTVSDIQITCINVVMPNGFVERNVISGCGLYVYGTSQFGNGIAAQGGTVQYNTITGCGYAAVLPAHGAYTYSNVINGAMLTLNDGAAIYTSGSQAQNLVVYQNTISNVVGNYASWQPWQIASCIFADQGSVGVSFANNICNSAPQCITFFQVTNGIILSNQCNAPGMYIREGTGNTLMANVVLTNGTSSTLQNPLIRMLADTPTLANGVFTAYYNSYCSSTGGATYLFQRQTSVGTIRYNDFQGWKNVEVANGNPYFEISSSYTQDCSRATSYFGPITGAVSAHAGAAVPPTAEEIRSLVQKKIAELPPLPNKKEVDVAAIVAPVVIGSVLIIIAVIATAVVMVRRERQKALDKTSVLGEPLNSIALRPIVYTMSPMAPITASTTSLSSSPSHSVEIHTV